MSVRDATHLAGPQPPEERTEPPVGRRRVPAPLAFLRNIWRQLTSMRTALVLLFLLALASLPGALLPQWSLNQAKTAQYIVDHPFLGGWLDRLGFFGVFGSPWYAAIYLLLFTSLVGCVLPRTWDFVGQLRMAPVATPRNLSRLPHHESLTVPGLPAERTADAVVGALRGWRVARRVEGAPAAGRPEAITVSAEKGFLREVGNLVFHLSLLGLLVAIALGKMFGYEGSIIVTAGTGTDSGFCSASPASYDNFRPGLVVDGTRMSPFCVQVDRFQAQYTDAGEATSFRADIRYQSGAAAGSSSWQSIPLEVNDPLRLAGQRLYLLGHGYSPTFTVTYPNGKTQTKTQPFQPQDSMFTSQGVVKFTDPPGVTGDAIRQHQLAVVGIFAPTQAVHGGIMTSTFPGLQDPGVAVDVLRGDLGMETGKSQSVFSIDQDQLDKGALKKVARSNLTPGQSITLDDGTRVTFTGVSQWVSLQTSYDPAEGWALIFAVLLLVGLMTSLTIKRRRIWFRITPGDAGGTDPGGPAGGPGPTAGSPMVTDSAGSDTVVQIGGLARTDQAGYGEEFGRLVARVRAATASGAVPSGKGDQT